jgi:D-alanyl-lipoteichoic acid acyltransferase DltB (MBOAT superfamily)
VLPRDWLTDLLATAGLSFLFFKLLHVLVDVADGSLKRPPPLHFANYCFNFTSFLLGPIQRFGDFDAQWTGRARSIEPTFEAHLDAVLRVLRGLVKKYVLAEYLHPYALTSEADVAALSAGALLLKTYVFYAFLYCDFSGYCDIVIGVGALIGLRPPENFRLPFLATNVADFWLRVHRSLTLWLTDYVFNPLYASLLRSAALRSQRLLALNAALTGTMLVSGLWHGTTASFVAFGLVHGVYLVVFRTYERVLTGKLGRKRLEAWRSTWVSRALGWTLTFNATAAAYVFFVLDFRSLTALLARLVSP